MDFTGLLKTVAPWLATAITGPLGGIAVEIAGNALGLQEKTTDSLKNALAGATPADLLALKKADQEFQAKMREFDIKSVTDLERIGADDRANAREMQKATHSRIPAILSILVTVGYFGILVGMMLGELKVMDSQALLLMLGSLTTAWGGVVAYWFGTSRSSAEKTQLLAKAPPIH